MTFFINNKSKFFLRCDNRTGASVDSFWSPRGWNLSELWNFHPSEKLASPKLRVEPEQAPPTPPHLRQVTANQVRARVRAQPVSELAISLQVDSQVCSTQIEASPGTQTLGRSQQTFTVDPLDQMMPWKPQIWALTGGSELVLLSSSPVGWIHWYSYIDLDYHAFILFVFPSLWNCVFPGKVDFLQSSSHF